MNYKEFAVGSTGASIAGVAANHYLTHRTKQEKVDVDKQLGASILGANALHLLLTKKAQAALEKAASRNK